MIDALLRERDHVRDVLRVPINLLNVRLPFFNSLFSKQYF
jgi:hypothetical protein